MPGESLRTEEPGGLRSIESQRAGHAWATGSSAQPRDHGPLWDEKREEKRMDSVLPIRQMEHSQQSSGGELVCFLFISFNFSLRFRIVASYAMCKLCHPQRLLAVTGSAWQLTLSECKIILLCYITSSPCMKLNHPWKSSNKEKSKGQVIFLLLSLKHKYVLVHDTWRSGTVAENSNGMWRSSEITDFIWDHQTSTS